MKLKLHWLYIILLTAPLWGLLFFIEQRSWPAVHTWAASFKFSFVQAFVSSLGALVLGGLVAGGLLACENPKTYQRLRFLILVLAALPSLMWISAYFWWSSLLEILPRGLMAITVVHSFMNLSLVALGIELIVKSRLGRYNEVSRTMGVNPTQFWLRVALPMVWRELILLLLVVFGFCFTSLSVPMIFSTPHNLTLEVLIYQWGVREGHWGHALSLSVIQWLLIAAISLSIGWFQLPLHNRSVSWRWLSHPALMLFIGLPVLFLSLGYLDLFEAFTHKSFWSDIAAVFSASALVGSLITGLLVAITFLLMLSGLALIGPHPLFRKFLRGYAAPSMAIVGVFLFLLPGNSITTDLLKLSLGLSLLFFPGLYRWMGESHFESLKDQWIQARVLGASPWLIAKKIWWPQSLEVMSWITGLAVLWAVSDFALSSMLLQRPFSLALVANEAFNGYRIEVGMAYTLFCLLLGSGFFVFIRKLLHVRN